MYLPQCTSLHVCENALLVNFKVMKTMKTIQPDMFVFTRHVPPVPIVARANGMVASKAGLGASPEPCMGALSPALSLMPQSHFSLLSSLLTARVCWPGFFNWVVFIDPR